MDEPKRQQRRCYPHPFLVLSLLVASLVVFTASSWFPESTKREIEEFLGDLREMLDSATKKTRILQQSQQTIGPHLRMSTCLARVEALLWNNSSHEQDSISLMLHHNGNASHCQELSLSTLIDTTLKTIQSMDSCPSLNKKYVWESFLTTVLANVAQSCHATDTQTPEYGFPGFCDRGYEKTPIQRDHAQLIPLRYQSQTFLPCHFHTHQGVRVTSLSQFTDWMYQREEEAQVCEPTTATDEQHQQCNSDTSTSTITLHLYAVPAGRLFLFTAMSVGDIIPLPHVKGGDPTMPVYLEALSLSPRVFDVVNFFSPIESYQVVQRALKETRDLYRMQRSTTGAVGRNVIDMRTSENGFDTNGKTAVTLKRYAVAMCCPVAIVF